MKKSLDYYVYVIPYRNCNKLLLTMKITCLLLFCSIVNLIAAPGYSQNTRISLSLKNATIEQVLNKIEDESEFYFFFNQKLIDVSKNVDIEVENQPIKGVLEAIFDDNVNWTVYDRQIILTPGGSPSLPELPPQQIITGIVKDSKGEPLTGVNVVIKGTTIGTITDINGKYAINATDKNGTFVFTSIGYTPQEVAISGRNNVDVILKEEFQLLSEVVVTALGIKRESKSLGYSASTVKTDEMVANRTTNVMKSLEGKVAGLEIAPPTAGAGASTRIRLRGQAGFNGQNNSPLLVINGLPMDQGARSAEGGGAPTDQGDNLANINPDDIESMTVLKGATAAALYGSRAGNGAIIITTKNGSKNSKFGVEFTSNFAADDIIDFTNYQTEYGTGSNGVRPSSQATAQSTGNLAWGEKYDGALTYQYDGVQRPYLPDKNRFKEFYNTGISTTNTLAVSGGNTTTSYRVSFSNLDVKGISPDNNYHKKIFNLGLNSKVTDKLTLQTNINYTHEENNNPPQVGTQGIGFSSFLHRVPLTIAIPTLKEHAVGPDGSLLSTNPFNALLTNPYYLIGRMFNYTKRDRFLGTVSLRYDFTNWLYLQGRVNADFGYNNNEANLPHGVGVPLRNSTNTGWVGSYNVATSYNRQMNMDFLLGATHNFGDFRIDGSLGGNMFTVKNNNNFQSVTDFVVQDIYSLGNGLTKNQNNYSIYRTQVNSLYAFADFSYKDFLFLNVTDRVDYFSVLTPPSSIVANPKNSFNYYSVGASFIFSELLPNLSWLNYGKLRGTYAIEGNANGVSPFSSQLTYSIGTQLFGTYPIGSIANGSNPNPNLGPAGVSEAEIGVEFKTLNSRLNFDLAVYDKRINNQILPVDLSPSSGYSSTNVNIAKLKNSGVELQIDGTPVRTPNFSWNISVNGAYNTSEVLALNPGQSRQVVVYFNGKGNEFLGSLVYDVGKEMNQLISYTYRRDDQGRIMLNSQGRLLASTAQVNYGSANAKVTSGITNTFQYKNLSLLIQLDGKFGGKVFSSTALNGLRSGMSQTSLVGRDGVVFDGVLPDGSKNTISVAPQIFYADYRTLQIADPFVFSSDFIKLRNITLSYDLTEVMARKVKFVKGLTLSAFCRNAAVLLKHIPDVDPEAFASSGDSRLGYEQHTEPTTRTIGFNLNVKF